MTDFFLLGLTFLLLTRGYFLFSFSFWLDEGHGFWIARDYSFNQLLSFQQWDTNHPPLFYLQTKLLQFIATYPWFLRLPSLLFSLGSGILIYLIGKKIKNKKFGLWCLFFFVTSNFATHLGYMLWMYSGVQFFSFLSLYLYLSIVIPAKAGIYKNKTYLYRFLIPSTIRCGAGKSGMTGKGILFFLVNGLGFFYDYSFLWYFGSLVVTHLLLLRFGSRKLKDNLRKVNKSLFLSSIYLIPVGFLLFKALFGLQSLIGKDFVYEAWVLIPSLFGAFEAGFWGRLLAYGMVWFLLVWGVRRLLRLRQAQARDKILILFSLVGFVLPVGVSLGISLLTGKSFIHFKNLFVAANIFYFLLPLAILENWGTLLPRLALGIRMTGIGIITIWLVCQAVYFPRVANQEINWQKLRGVLKEGKNIIFMVESPVFANPFRYYLEGFDRNKKGESLDYRLLPAEGIDDWKEVEKKVGPDENLWILLRKTRVEKEVKEKIESFCSRGLVLQTAGKRDNFYRCLR